jgi:hypothetical protein
MIANMYKMYMLGFGETKKKVWLYVTTGIRLLFVMGFRPLSGLLSKIACKCVVDHSFG